MSIKPKKFIYICASCGWSKKISPKSDCLMPSDYYEKCPVCNSGKLQTKQLTSTIKRIFNNLFS